MTEQPYIEEEDEHVDEKLTRIVSYLDGELDLTQMNEVEQALVRDPELRGEAESLSRTWAMLDCLEEVSVDRSFTQDTLATIAAEEVSRDTASGGSLLSAAWRRLLKQYAVAWFLIGLIGTGVGLTAARWLVSAPEDSVEERTRTTAAQDADLLINVEFYDLVPNADALKTLRLKQHE
ncbi:MAG: hypothetical protein KDA89_01150 [Planctomycetaceae bacterium]|nr:hypothetical protein [Planctomycetaceae bacterium]